MLLLIVSAHKLLLELLCQGCFPAPFGFAPQLVDLRYQSFLQQVWIYICEVQHEFRTAQKSTPQPVPAERQGCLHAFRGACGLGHCLQPAEHHMCTPGWLASCPEEEQHLGTGFGTQ